MTTHEIIYPDHRFVTEHELRLHYADAVADGEAEPGLEMLEDIKAALQEGGKVTFAVPPRRLSFTVRSELYVVGRTEDGTNYTAERYFVIATDARGRRWEHDQVFPSSRLIYPDEPEAPPFCFTDERYEAIEAADALCKLLRAAGTVDEDHWREGQPAYGSAAYEDRTIDELTAEWIEARNSY